MVGQVHDHDDIVFNTVELVFDDFEPVFEIKGIGEAVIEPLGVFIVPEDVRLVEQEQVDQHIVTDQYQLLCEACQPGTLEDGISV